MQCRVQQKKARFDGAGGQAQQAIILEIVREINAERLQLVSWKRKAQVWKPHSYNVIRKYLLRCLQKTESKKPHLKYCREVIMKDYAFSINGSEKLVPNACCSAKLFHRRFVESCGFRYHPSTRTFIWEGKGEEPTEKPVLFEAFENHFKKIVKSHGRNVPGHDSLIIAAAACWLAVFALPFDPAGLSTGSFSWRGRCSTVSSSLMGSHNPRGTTGDGSTANSCRHVWGLKRHSRQSLWSFFSHSASRTHKHTHIYWPTPLPININIQEQPLLYVILCYEFCNFNISGSSTRKNTSTAGRKGNLQDLPSACLIGGWNSQPTVGFRIQGCHLMRGESLLDCLDDR